MANAIIILILMMIAILGIRSSLRHFKGEGGCCGGGKIPKQTKKLSNPIGKKKILIEGIHCNNCKNSIERAINKLEGVSAKVDLKNQQVIIEIEQEVENHILIEAVESEGYKVIKIETIYS